MVAVLKTSFIEQEQDDFFLMANLRQKTTGLPMVIWVSEHGDAKHGARIKVSTSHSEKIIELSNQAKVEGDSQALSE